MGMYMYIFPPWLTLSPAGALGTWSVAFVAGETSFCPVFPPLGRASPLVESLTAGPFPSSSTLPPSGTVSAVSLLVLVRSSSSYTRNVYEYVYVYVHVNAHMHVYVHVTYMYTYMYMYMYVYMYVYVYIYTHYISVYVYPGPTAYAPLHRCLAYCGDDSSSAASSFKHTAACRNSRAPWVEASKGPKDHRNTQGSYILVRTVRVQSTIIQSIYRASIFDYDFG